MKIPKEKLLELITQEGVLGDWRNMLREGYQPDDYYFEFGIYPTNIDEYEIIINHHRVIVLGEVKDSDNRWLITNTKQKNRRNTFYVDSEIFSAFLEEARMIYEEYKMPDSMCFWSIPNKWFSEIKLVQFIENEIPNIGTGMKTNWYWP